MFFFGKRSKPTIMDRNTLPVHIAIVMDGNGRWARGRGLPRSAGHREGANTLKKIVRYSDDIGK